MSSMSSLTELSKGFLEKEKVIWVASYVPPKPAHIVQH